MKSSKRHGKLRKIVSGLLGLLESRVVLNPGLGSLGDVGLSHEQI